MSTDRKNETKEVKAALAAAGIKAQVTHGKGTAWGWLHVRAIFPDVPHRSILNTGEAVTLSVAERGRLEYYAQCTGHCEGCEATRQLDNRIKCIVHETTGRHGEYDGRVTINWEYPAETKALVTA
jgi:hypothetical protein